MRSRASATARLSSLDDAVVGVLADAVLKPERLTRILEAYIAQSAKGDATRRERLARARKEVTEAAAKKTRLMQLVSAGALEPDDPQLVEELRGAEARRRRAEEEVALLDGHRQSVEPTKGDGFRPLRPRHQAGRVQALAPSAEALA